MAFSFFRLQTHVQTTILLWPSEKWGRVLNDLGKEDAVANVAMEDLLDTWL